MVQQWLLKGDNQMLMVFIILYFDCLVILRKFNLFKFDQYSTRGLTTNNTKRELIKTVKNNHALFEYKCHTYMPKIASYQYHTYTKCHRNLLLHCKIWSSGFKICKIMQKRFGYWKWEQMKLNPQGGANSAMSSGGHCHSSSLI